MVAASLLYNTTLYLNLYERLYLIDFTGYFMITKRAYISGDHAPRRWEDCNSIGDWALLAENKPRAQILLRCDKQPTLHSTLVENDY